MVRCHHDITGASAGASSWVSSCLGRASSWSPNSPDNDVNDEYSVASLPLHLAIMCAVIFIRCCEARILGGGGGGGGGEPGYETRTEAHL